MCIRRALWTSVGLGALFAAGLAHATDITVVDGETLAVPQILSGAGDTLSLNFNTDGHGTTWQGFTGLDVAYETDANGRLFLGAEVSLSSGGAAFEGRAGFDLAL
jgi:hypothetical protein